MREDFIAQANKRLLFKTPPEELTRNVNVAILSASRSVCGDVANAALADYHSLSGRFKKFAICGGKRVCQPLVWPIAQGKAWKNGPAFVNPRHFCTTKKEAHYMRHILLKGGVRPEDIICVDDTSQHTDQHFQNTRAKIKEEGFETARIYTAAYDQRRVIETCAVEIPELHTVPMPVYPFATTREEWMMQWPTTLGIKNVVLGEYHKIDPNNPDNYYERGICTPVPHWIKLPAPIKINPRINHDIGNVRQQFED